MRVTKKQVKSCATFFNRLYAIHDYSHGTHIVRYGHAPTNSAFFWSDGTITISGAGIEGEKRVGVGKAARHIGMVGVLEDAPE